MRYTGHFNGGLGGSTPPKFMSLGKSLAMRRNTLRPSKPAHIAPVKPSLTSSKQKEAEIQKTIDKSYLPSGLKLAKLRQLAAQHKILGEHARDFLHRSAGGVKQQGTEGLKKFETELLEAEREAIAAQGGHDPMKFEYRKDADHPERLAKKMVKGLYKDAAKEAQEHAADHHANVMEERQQRLAAIHGIMDRGQPNAQAPAQASTGSAAPSSQPSLIQPTPLPNVRPTFTPLSGGGHITEDAAHTSVEPTISAPTTIAPESPAPISEPVVTPTAPEPAPPVVDVQLPDTSHLSDPFGGED